MKNQLRFNTNLMKKLLAFAFCFSLLLGVYAQKGKKDVVYLKSGSILKGTLITHDAEVVKINSGGNSWVFNVSEVDSISNRSVREKVLWNSNYFFDMSIGVLAGNSSNDQDAPFTFMTSGNYRVADRLWVGAGTGVEFYSESYLPVFGQLSYQFRNDRFSPFVSFQAGYLIPLEKEQSVYSINSRRYYDYYPYPQNNTDLNTKGGAFFSPSIGFRSTTSDNFGWFFSFGYRYHQLRYTGSNAYELESNYNRLALRIGFIFK